MDKEKKLNTKKVVIYSCLSLTFGLLSFYSYNTTKKEDPKAAAEIIFKVGKTNKKKEIEVKSNIYVEKSTTASSIVDAPIKIITTITPINEISGKYITVIGTFRQKNNAISLCKSMLLKGYVDCKIIYNGTSLYWVSFNNYNSLSAAKKDIINYNLDGWIKKI